MYNKWDEQKYLGQCFNFPLNTKYLPSIISVRFAVSDWALYDNEMKVSTTYYQNYKKNKIKSFNETFNNTSKHIKHFFILKNPRPSALN